MAGRGARGPLDRRRLPPGPGWLGGWTPGSSRWRSRSPEASGGRARLLGRSSRSGSPSPASASRGSCTGGPSDVPARIAPGCRGSRGRSSTSSTSTRPTTASFYEPASRDRARCSRATSSGRSSSARSGRSRRGARTSRTVAAAPDRLRAHVRARRRGRARRPRHRLHLWCVADADHRSSSSSRSPARSSCGSCPGDRARGRRLGAARRAGRARRLGRPQRFDFDYGGPRLQHDTHAVWFEDLGVSYTRRAVRLLALARRPDRRRHGRRGRLRLLGGARAAARLLRAAALPRGRDGRRLHRPGPAALLRLLGGDADPALRPDRRLGRAGTLRRDAQVRHLHDGGLAAHARLDHRARPLERARST